MSGFAVLAGRLAFGVPVFVVLAGRLAFGVPVLAVLLRCLPSVHACLCDVGGAADLSAGLALRFWRGGLAFGVPVLAVLAGAVGLGSSCLYGSGGAFGLRCACPCGAGGGRFDTRFMTGGCGSVAVFVLGSSCLYGSGGALPSVRVWLCGSGGAFGLGSCLSLRFWRGAWPSVCLSLRFCCGVLASACLSLRFCCGVLPSVCLSLQRRRGGLPSIHPAFATLAGRLASVHVCLCGSVAVFALGSRLLFAAWRQTGRLAMPCVSIPPGRDRHSCVLAALARLSALAGSLRVCAFICGDPDGVIGERRNEERSWRRGLCAFLRKHIGLDMLSAGSTLGLRAPNLRQRVFNSLDSPHAAAGLCWCGFAAFVRLCAIASALCVFAQSHRPCESFRREYVGAARPKPAPKSLRLSGLSSRCGGVVLVQIRILAKSANTPISAPTLAKPGYTERPARL